MHKSPAATRLHENKIVEKRVKCARRTTSSLNEVSIFAVVTIHSLKYDAIKRK